MQLKSVQLQFLLGYAVLFLAIMGCASLFLWNPLPLQVIRNVTFDQFQRLKPRVYQDTQVRIVDIDEESLSRLGQWPWPRTRIAQLILQLNKARPAAIAVDIIFAEKDRTSPVAVLDMLQLPENKREWLSQLPDHDQVLADTLGKSHVALGFALSRAPAGHMPLDIKAHYIQRGESPLPYLDPFSGAISSLPILEQAAAGSGALTFIADVDGVIRKVPLLLNYNQTMVPSLIAETLRLAQNENNYLVGSRAKGEGIASIKIGDWQIPTTASGEIWIHFSPRDQRRYLSAWRVLSGDIDPEQLTNKILLIGASAQGLMDLRFSPLGGIIPGIDVHAQALEQILANQLLIQPEWAESAEMLVIVLGGVLLGSLTLSMGALSSFVALLIGISLLWFCAWSAFAGPRLLIDPMVPSVLLLMIFLITSLFRHLYSERRQRWVKQAFSRYISPNLVEHLINHPEELRLGGDRQICSFVFTDLADFTAFMEGLDPAQAVSILNNYLENMIAIAFSHHGTLDRIVGDAVAIMFSAPVRQADHQRRAIQCALDMQRYAQRYAAELNAKGIAFGQTRVGVHSGQVIVGNFGGKTLFDYRALGDAVNIASRLEGANKYLGTLICASEATVSGCPDLPARPIGRLLVKGKSIALTVYEVLQPGALDSQAITDYRAAYALLCDGKIEQATLAFRAILVSRPNDSLSEMHLNRLSKGASDDLIELSQK